MIVVAYAIAVLLPLGFLYLIYAQDLYGQGKFKFVLLSFAWGGVAFGLAYYTYSLFYQPVAREVGSMIAPITMSVLFAPIYEEIYKSGMVLALNRRLTYFVDGAIYGFASGIAFSVLENILYLSRVSGAEAGLLMFLRTITTCLMHGSASALVGTAVGRFRYGHGGHRLLSAALGWAGAIALHMAFNRLVNATPSAATMGGSLAIGLGSVVLIILFIRSGLKAEKRWIEETLGIGVGVTRGEKAVVRQYDHIDELLEPIAQLFGDEKAEQVEEFVLKQAQLGIKRKSLILSREQGGAPPVGLQAEIDKLHDEMQAIRKRVGVYCMTYVRTIFPEDAIELYGMLERLVKADALPDGGGLLHKGAAARMTEGVSGQEGMWGRLGQ